MEKYQITCFYAAVVLVSSHFSVEGGALDQTFGWGWGGGQVTNFRV
jgi:hypothetical protein